jgi:prephenate dehydratase
MRGHRSVFALRRRLCRLANGTVEAAVIPIENSLAGSVSEHFDLLLTHDVKVERETLLRIRHNLIAISGASIGEIDRVFSHPVALAQCRRFLAEHPRWRPSPSTTPPAASSNWWNCATATPRPSPARPRPTTTARRSFRPASKTTRRTLPASSSSAAPSDAVADPESNKISVAFSVENRPGSLVAALNELSSIGTNLTKIESRPVHGKPWEYIFYVDCQIHSPRRVRARSKRSPPLRHGQGAGPLPGSAPAARNRLVKP